MKARDSSLIRRAAIAMFVALMLVVSQVATASAAPQVIPYEGVFYPCGTIDGQAWVSGNTLHVRGAQNHNVWDTGNPLVDGPEHNVANLDINLSTGQGVAHPRSTISPLAVDGTWEMRITVDISPDVLTAHGVGRGTGELGGMTLFFESSGWIDIDPADNPCSDMTFAVLVEGAVLAPRGK